LRFFYIKTKEQVSFKQRNHVYKNFSKLTFGNLGFFFIKNFRFEYLYFLFFKKLLKLLNKNKFASFNKFFFWFFLKGNFPLTKKSKNARMGKGKGVFSRWVIILANNFFFLEFLTYNSEYFFKYFSKRRITISPYLRLYKLK